MAAGGGTGMIGNGVVVPAYTWKVVLVLPNGTDDLNRVTANTRAFAVWMSNTSINRNAPWRNFRVPVERIQRNTGYSFFTNVPAAIRDILIRRREKL